MKIQLYTTAPVTGQEYRINDASGLQWFSHYGPDGSGFGYMSFRVKRRVGFNYADIGHAYRVRIYKGPWRCLFDGQLTRLSERITPDGGEIECWCLGWIHTANADTFNRVYRDNRYNQWFTSETPDDHFQPQKFSVETSSYLLLKPRQGSLQDDDFVLDGDYTYLRYVFSFGESAVHLTADYKVELPGSFPAKAQIWAGDVLLWECAATASGALDLLATNGAATFEIRFVITADGDVSAEDDTVYALFWNVAVSSTSISVLDQKVIADDIVQVLQAHGLSADTQHITPTGFNLAQAVFETDQTPADVLTWACEFGDANGNPLAWGVMFDDQRTLFLEAMNLSSVGYVLDPVRAESIERIGDWAESAQIIYGVFTTPEGQVYRTADYGASQIIDRLGGYYRRQAVNLGTLPSNLVASLLTTYLNEKATPQTTGSYIVRQAWTGEGRPIPFDEFIPGKLAQIREFRALEAEGDAADFRDKTTTFMVYGLTVSHDDGTVELMADTQSSDFQRQMAVIEHLTSR